MTADGVLRELEGMRALARVLALGDADDLLQDAAVDVLGHPLPEEAPPRPWLAAVLRNRWRMTARGAARRAVREQAVVPDDVEAPDAVLDRARTFERLAGALVGLDEPFRQTVIHRYLDGHSAAEIARMMNVPAGTVRWRLKTGLDRLRAALDDTEPKWRRACAPLAGAGIMKAKTTSIAIVLALLLLGSAALYFIVLRKDEAPAAQPVVAMTPVIVPGVRKVKIDQAIEAALPPGQGKPILDAVAGAGVVSGRVVNWSTGDGVDGADLTFSNAAGATTVRSGKGGVFELAPEEPGGYVLATISAPGFLPYAPELLHSNVHLEVVPNRAVRGITVFLFPAVDYEGIVVDEQAKPIAGAKVRLLGTPVGEQMIDKLETEWTSDKDGKFTFHAADDAVFQASFGKLRGYGVLDGSVAITHVMRIVVVTNAPARDRSIAGRVVDGGKPVANALVRAEPAEQDPVHVRSVAFATTDASGAFTLEDVDDRAYELFAEADGYAQARLQPVMGGAKDVVVTLDKGQTIAGRVVDTGGDPIGAYTLLGFERIGARRELVLARSVVDARGRFSVQVPADGELDLSAAASGWAPSKFVVARAGDREVTIEVSEGATLSGKVMAADGSGPIPYTRVMREARGGGSSAQPANAGTVTRDDGTFELAGIPPGPVSVTIAAGGFHPKIEAGLTSTDGAKLGPVTIILVALKPGETPQMELVGIGVKLSVDGKAVMVTGVISGSGAEAAGMLAGEELVAVDGIPLTRLGLDGAIAKIRGVEGTTLGVTVQRDGKPVTLVVTRKKFKA